MPIFAALNLSLFALVEKSTTCLDIFKLPDVGESIKESKFKRVDLPEPDGPTKEYIFPA